MFDRIGYFTVNPIIAIKKPLIRLIISIKSKSLRLETSPTANDPKTMALIIAYRLQIGMIKLVIRSKDPVGCERFKVFLTIVVPSDQIEQFANLPVYRNQRIRRSSIAFISLLPSSRKLFRGCLYLFLWSSPPCINLQTKSPPWLRMKRAGIRKDQSWSVSIVD